jgi:Uncharacterized protein conserved in bacteria
MVLNGIDCIGDYENLFKGKRIGLITSPSGLNSRLDSTINILHSRFKLTALFSPEHGVRGNITAGGLVDTYIDPYIHVPVYSLYRKDSKRFTDEMLDCVDLVVYDIQDVGTRYFTFIYTMLYALEDCAKHGKEFVVLDRADPLNGVTVEGNILKDAFRSFVGAYPLCMRYGLTIGEFAKMANQQENLHANLTVIPCKGWNRSWIFPDYNKVWVPPTMGIARFEAALLYPGTCLFESTNISEGRGTTVPFEIIGAPFVDAQLLANEMNAKKLPDVIFRPVYFMPSTSKFTGEQCGGVQIHVTDLHKVQPVRIGVELLYEVRREYGERFEFLPPYPGSTRCFAELLSGDNKINDPGVKKEELLYQYQQESKAFEQMKQEFHLYES